MKHIKRTSITILLFCIFVFAVRQTFAQTTNPIRTTLTVTPPLSEIIIKPGKTITQAFTIKNEGGVDLEVTPSIVDFSPDGKTGAPIVLPNNANFPFASLENLDKKMNTPFKLKAGTSDQLVVHITIPEKAEEKEYYQTLIFKTQPLGLNSLDNTRSISNAWIGVHMLISVSNTGEQLGNLTTHSFEYPKVIDMFSPLVLKLTAKNTGKNYVKAQGDIKISNMMNDVVKVLPILPENVLAQSVRELHASIPDPNDPKSATAVPFEYRPLFLFGPHRIEVNLYAERQTQEPQAFMVYALPISPTLAVLALYVAHTLRKKYQSAQTHA